MPKLRWILHDGVLLPFQDVPFLQEKSKDTGEHVIDMKCLECGYEEEIPLDIFSELFNPEIEVNPALTCPKCDHDLFVPRDVYDQIKGNFVYKPNKK